MHGVRVLTYRVLLERRFVGHSDLPVARSEIARDQPSDTRDLRQRNGRMSGVEDQELWRALQWVLGGVAFLFEKKRK